MNTRTVVTIAAALVALGATAFIGYRLGASSGHGPDAHAPAAAAAPASEAAAMAVPEGEAATRRHIAAGLKAGDVDPANGRKILYYHDPMTPGTKFDRPAKSPFMDMMLVPVYADAGADASQVTVSARVQQNLGLRTAEVSEGLLGMQLAVVGSIAWNERDQAVVQTRAAGWIERLHVRATLDRVTVGQPLVDLQVPEWAAAQEEFLSLRRMQSGDLAPLIDAARTRMRLLGMSEAHIAQVETSGRAQPRFTLTAPISGVVVELAAREGMSVAAGAMLMRLNGLATVWAEGQVPESQAASLHVGAPVTAQTPALPGKIFNGRVQAIVPTVDPTTRTLKARVELANPGAQLTPGLFVTLQFADPRATRMLMVPSEAVIQTGRRSVVMLAEDGGTFRPVQVQTGQESDGRTEIRSGLQRGQRVVVSSQFLIDSEASLRGLEARLNAADAAASGAMPGGKP
jgi:Cu(I)/Ag(I) efflux system membrane fusion protein